MLDSTYTTKGAINVNEESNGPSIQRFDVIKDVNVKFYMPSVCQNQTVGDTNLYQSSGFMIIVICHYYCSFPEGHIKCMSF